MGNQLHQRSTSEQAVPSTISSATIAAEHPSVTNKSADRSWGTAIVRGLILVVVFSAGWTAANARRDQHAKESLPTDADVKARDRSAVVVTVEPIAERTVQRTVEALGTLYGFEEVTISARVEGRIRKLLHDVSDRVQLDELLLEIDPTDYQLSVRQSDRALQVELARLGLKTPPDSKIDLSSVPFVAKARSSLEHAKSRLDRINRLAATKNVSAEESESASADYRTAVAEYDNQMIQAEAGLATIQMKQVDLLVAREHLANTKVHAPVPTVEVPGTNDVSYIISQRSVSEGTVVRPGTELFRVVINQTLKLRVPVPERYSSEIQTGQSVQVHTAASTIPCAGTVSRIYPTVEPGTRTFHVEIQVPNPNGELKPGSFAKAVILTRSDPHAITVPLAALVQFAGITKIFLAEEGRAKEVPVLLGTQTTDWVEIVKPSLPTGSQVITSGQMTIASDSVVAIREPAAAIDAQPRPHQVDAPVKPSKAGVRE